MKITVFYVGASLLSPFKQAERTIADKYAIPLEIDVWNLGAPIDHDKWESARDNVRDSSIVFVFHVVEGENSAHLIQLLSGEDASQATVIVVNCMPDLMRCTRMGKLHFAKLFSAKSDGRPQTKSDQGRSIQLLSGVAGWMGKYASSKKSGRRRSPEQYLRFVDKLPAVLRFMPTAGALRDVKHYLNIFCYFLQPTPRNIESLVLYTLKHYGPPADSHRIVVKQRLPEHVPSIAIYHPDAPDLFETFDGYKSWHSQRPIKNPDLQCEQTIGLLMMRPQIVSGSREHYDQLIRAIEHQGLSVIPAISTFMDNRISCQRFFVEDENGRAEPNESRPRVSQIVSLTGFSFVGGPAMNDSAAAVEYFKQLNVPFRSMVSLDMQTIESWDASQIGLNPVQAGMQVAIPEIDGSTEPFVYGGLSENENGPVPIHERCETIASRLAKWNRLRVVDRSDLKVALVVFCFPPDKGNIGTAADLDVIPSVFDILRQLKTEGYAVELPSNPEDLRKQLIEGNSDRFGSNASVAYAMEVDEYWRLCDDAGDAEREWGAPPGGINSFGGKLLIQGANFGNVFVGVQPTFGYEGDPTRMLMSRSACPNHAFLAFYAYLKRKFCADIVVHVGTHGALEFMPGKQVGLSQDCWPDRLIGDLPNVYLYSVNNPSEGTIAKRRSYAELISYLTPPIESAGLYRELAELKELIQGYRTATTESEKNLLFRSIETAATSAHLVDRTDSKLAATLM